MYDRFNQLICEDNFADNTMTEFSYDGIGNITSKTTYNYTTLDLIKDVTYRYGKDGKSGWNNLLTGVDLNGNGSYSSSETISYDAIGNPTTYLGNSLTWFGRQLTGYSNSNQNISYTYDADGYRASKTVNGETTTYQYLNGMLVYECGPEREIFYLYDSYNNLTGLRVYPNGSTSATNYYVTTNIQGDVLGIYNANGVQLAAYEYDAWGNVLSVTDANGTEITDAAHIAHINPFRYRGYYLDKETGLYYLNSRYYNAEVGRFLNADSVVSGTGGEILGYNMFAYCFNNPVNMSDASGNWPKWVKKAAKWVNDNIIKPVKNYISSRNQKNVISSVSHDSNRRPNKGEPGSTYTAPNGDKRTYGPDGNPERDYDHNDHGRPDKHPHDANGGHNHDWKNGIRGPAYSVSLEPIIGIALVTTCVLGITIVAVNNVTGIGVVDDFLVGPLGAGVSKGLVLIF